MAKVTYDQAYLDHQYLWSIGPAADMTGGYVDQGDLAKLLKNPTKATALQCLENQIVHWFMVGTDDENIDELMRYHPELEEIRDRYL